MCARAELTSGLELPTFRKGRAEQYTTIIELSPESSTRTQSTLDR